MQQKFKNSKCMYNKNNLTKGNMFQRKCILNKRNWIPNFKKFTRRILSFFLLCASFISKAKGENIFTLHHWGKNCFLKDQYLFRCLSTCWNTYKQDSPHQVEENKHICIVIREMFTSEFKDTRLSAVSSCWVLKFLNSLDHIKLHSKKHFWAQSCNTKDTVILLQGSRNKSICFSQ